MENIIGQHAILVASGHRYCNIEVSFWNKCLSQMDIDDKLYSSKVFQNMTIFIGAYDYKFFIQSKDSRLG